MNSLKQTVVHCWISRLEPAEMLPGIVMAWTEKSLQILLSSSAGLRLDESVMVAIDCLANPPLHYPARIARLSSRVVSITWQQAGDCVGLSIQSIKWKIASVPKRQLGNRPCRGPVS